MATVKVGLKIDTQQAQQNVDKLKKRAVEIEKQLQKRLKMKLDTQEANRALNSLQKGVTGKTGISTAKTATGATGGAAGGGGGLLSGLGGLKGLGIAGAALAVGNFVKELVMSTQAVKNITEAFNAGKEALLSPGEEVAKRVGLMGELDDRARAAGVTRAEKFAFEQATRIAFGQDSSNMVARVSAGIAEAITGNEQKTAALQQLGLTYEDVAGKSEQEQFLALLAAADKKMTSPSSAYDKAATTDALRELVGARGIGSFLQMRGESGNVLDMYNKFLADFNKEVPEYKQQAMIEADDKREFAKVANMISNFAAVSPFEAGLIDQQIEGERQKQEASNLGLHTAGSVKSAFSQFTPTNTREWYNKQYQQNAEMKNLTSAVSSLNNTIKEADSYNKQRDNQQATAPATFN